GPAPCAAGVVFLILWLVARDMAGGGRVSEPHRLFLTEALGLAALGTVADVVPLRGGNRLLARFGLRALGATTRPGLRALLDVARVNARPPTSTDIAYGLAPRLNAAGRLGSADLALELLLTDDSARGVEIAALLDRENRKRREIENGILAHARARVDAEYGPDHHGALVLADPSWHAGVIGIVAARLADSYRRPVALVAIDGELGRGSCRSVPAVHLTEVLSKCSDHLESFGGHAAAAGFSIRPGNFEGFRRSFDEAVRLSTTREDFLRRIRIDAVAPLAILTPAVVREIERLEPFGEGNPEPVFATRGLTIAGRPRRMGRDGEHLAFIVSDGTTSRRAVGFRMGSRQPELEKAGLRLDIAYTPRLDTYRGDGSVELELSDVVAHDG
ncbi:MAG: DHHA1 domain-containing protein, partial [Planctomycetes bacterium]|nr:DHHA1 domain-containing protein [Planctomycetota bacterium]